jgi:alkylation response protein AidB-like acyl-CoA dehydrogenase
MLIRNPEDPSLAALCARLQKAAAQLEAPGAWPQEQLEACAQAGVYRWFVESRHGGWDWPEADLLRAYVALAAACLTTTFVLTQRMGAVQRIASGASELARAQLLEDLLAGRTFATVGISHLTTSRQHLGRPALRAEEAGDSLILDGYSPWVTGADHAQHLVLGATLGDGRQVLTVVPTDLPGVHVEPPLPLLGLTASHTGPVRLERVRVPRAWLLAGPSEQVLQQGVGARTGGLPTSALALGLASAAIAYLQEQSVPRSELLEPTEALQAERDALVAAMLALASPVPATANAQGLAPHELRRRANSLALRATQAALVAAKGAGYVMGHTAGRWCREALFFLVWSCPQPVVQANLCELAHLA